jgi:hypothetical protein
MANAIRKPGIASGVALAERYGDERTQEQLLGDHFTDRHFDPPPKQTRTAKGRKKKSGRKATR